MLRDLRRSVGRQLAILVVLGGLSVWGADAALRVLLVLGGSEAAGAPVALDAARLHLSAGRLELDALRLGSPAGFGSAAFLRVGDVRIALDRTSLAQDALEIPVISMRGVSLHIERRGERTNAGEILRHLRRLGAMPGGWAQRRVLVRRLELRDCIAHVVFAPGLGARGETYVELPPLVVNDIGSVAGGLSLAELSHRLVEQLVSLALLEVARSGQAPVPAGLQQQLQSRLARVEPLRPPVDGVDLADGRVPRSR